MIVELVVESSLYGDHMGRFMYATRFFVVFVFR